MSEVILESIKGSLGLAPGHTAFDDEILMHVNSAISTLTQIGVGPTEGFYITSNEAVWKDLVGEDRRLNAVRTYVHLRVKLLFDPPEVGFVLTAMKEQIRELESRLNMIVDDVIPEEETTDVDD